MGALFSKSSNTTVGSNSVRWGSYRGKEGAAKPTNEKVTTPQEKLAKLNGMVVELQNAVSALKPSKGEPSEDKHYPIAEKLLATIATDYDVMCRKVVTQFLDIAGNSSGGCCQRYDPECKDCAAHGCACFYLLVNRPDLQAEFQVGERPLSITKTYQAADVKPQASEDEKEERDPAQWVEPGATIVVHQIMGPTNDKRIRARIAVGSEQSAWVTVSDWSVSQYPELGIGPAGACDGVFNTYALPTKPDFRAIYEGIQEVSVGIQALHNERIALGRRLRDIVSTCKICSTPKWKGNFAKLHGEGEQEEHKACQRCAKLWLKGLVGYASNGRCPCKHDCKLPPSAHCVNFALKDEKEVNNFWDRIVEKKMASVPNVRFCPAPRCGAPLIVDLDDKCRNLECPWCKIRFCRDCQNEWHDEIGDGTCAEYVRFQLEKVHGTESVAAEMEHWKVKKATGRKQCPMCCVMIEKNQGCQHMTCKKCTHEFYWCCGANYRGVGAGCICSGNANQRAPPNHVGKLFDDIFNAGLAIKVSDPMAPVRLQRRPT